MCHRRAPRRAVRVDHVDNRPIGEIGNRGVGKLLQDGALIGRDEQVRTELGKQPLARLGALLIGNVEARPDQLCRLPRPPVGGKMHPGEGEDPSLAAVGTHDSILTLKAAVAGRVGSAHQRGVQSFAVVGIDPCLDHARPRSRVLIGHPEELTNPIVERGGIGRHVPRPRSETRRINGETVASLVHCRSAQSMSMKAMNRTSAAECGRGRNAAARRRRAPRGRGPGTESP